MRWLTVLDQRRAYLGRMALALAISFLFCSAIGGNGGFMGVFRQAMESALSAVHANATADIWTIEAGKEKKLNGKIEVQPAARVITFQGGAGQLTYDEVGNIAMIIDELSYAESTYDNIMRQNVFRQLYQVDYRPISYVNGVTPWTKSELSVPCQVCGLLLPITHITIDHARPQTGGGVEAVAKMLRILDFTIGGPVGQKAQSLQAAVGAALKHQQGLSAGLNALQLHRKCDPVPTRTGRPPRLAAASTLVDRYSLNWTGYLFYSAVKALGKMQQLEVRCMHSLVNLRPLCGPCNGSRGNPLKFV